MTIDCPTLSGPVWVDRDMWEKIVPNLVSNAFKFTHSGEIAVRMREEADHVVLDVSDTGVGIPEAELPKIFERFHRVAGAGGRTHEGAGIGLSLVRELVELHGGQVRVESTLGRGTTFRVTIPKGFAHLPSEAVSHLPVGPGASRDATAHVVEAERWTGKRQEETVAYLPSVETGAAKPRARVLVVDDNADLRAYVSGLLSPAYDVSAVSDGLAGLEAIRARVPDIVVSDVMMPGLDGFGLVRALRADVRTASLPVILLSARAGEESAVEGLEAGADDYLVKPFSARELFARVHTHVELARARQAYVQELERTNRELDAFSYSVSHDLRAPLRAIHGFGEALLEEYGRTLDARAQGYLDHICRSVKEMNALIDDLLALARINQSAVVSEHVDLAELAEEVIVDLKSIRPERRVEVEIDDQMLARGDRRLLRVALVNLLGNAWKFTSKCESAHISVGRHAGEDSTFFVRDNGAGFDMAYASRLFSPFHRLHGTSEFEGTGLGLATVQRVICRHGGRIWADAEVGHGATFYFSLPEREQATT